MILSAKPYRSTEPNELKAKCYSWEAPSVVQRRSSRVIPRSQSLSKHEASSAEVPPEPTGVAIMRHIVLSFVFRLYDAVCGCSARYEASA